jgi:hypothetical protein
MFPCGSRNATEKMNVNKDDWLGLFFGAARPNQLISAAGAAARAAAAATIVHKEFMRMTEDIVCVQRRTQEPQAASKTGTYVRLAGITLAAVAFCGVAMYGMHEGSSVVSIITFHLLHFVYGMPQPDM